MESNNIVTAPQLSDVDEFYEAWRSSHVGSLASFYRFMTTPSVERDKFVREMDAVIDCGGMVVSVTLELK